MSHQDRQILCDRCGQIMADFLDGNADTASQQQLRKRLESNPDCLACFESYRKTAQLCKKAFSTPVPEAVGHRLASFLRRECGKKG